MTSALLSQAKVNWHDQVAMACSDRPRRTPCPDIFAGESSIQHHLRHRDLAAHGLAAGFEIDGFRQALFGFGARLVVEKAETFGRRLGVLIVELTRPSAQCSPFAARTGPSHQQAMTHHLQCRDQAPGSGNHDGRLSPGRQRSMRSAGKTEGPRKTRKSRRTAGGLGRKIVARAAGARVTAGDDARGALWRIVERTGFERHRTSYCQAAARSSGLHSGSSGAESAGGARSTVFAPFTMRWKVAGLLRRRRMFGGFLRLGRLPGRHHHRSPFGGGGRPWGIGGPDSGRRRMRERIARH